MFWKRKESQSEDAAPEASKSAAPSKAPSKADISPWTAGDDPENGIEHAKRAKARGRYEVARAFQIAGADWYEKHVVKGKPMPGETAADHKRYKEYLEDYRAEIENLLLAALDRDAMLALLKAAPGGLTRQGLETGHKLQCSTKLGVMLNQLEKGGWIRREGEGEKQVVRAVVGVSSDAEYLKMSHKMGDR